MVCYILILLVSFRLVWVGLVDGRCSIGSGILFSFSSVCWWVSVLL